MQVFCISFVAIFFSELKVIILTFILCGIVNLVYLFRVVLIKFPNLIKELFQILEGNSNDFSKQVKFEFGDNLQNVLNSIDITKRKEKFLIDDMKSYYYDLVKNEKFSSVRNIIQMLCHELGSLLGATRIFNNSLSIYSEKYRVLLEKSEDISDKDKFISNCENLANCIKKQGAAFSKISFTLDNMRSKLEDLADSEEYAVTDSFKVQKAVNRIAFIVSKCYTQRYNLKIDICDENINEDTEVFGDLRRFVNAVVTVIGIIFKEFDKHLREKDVTLKICVSNESIRQMCFYIIGKGINIEFDKRISSLGEDYVNNMESYILWQAVKDSFDQEIELINNQEEGYVFCLRMPIKLGGEAESA